MYLDLIVNTQKYRNSKMLWPNEVVITCIYNVTRSISGIMYMSEKQARIKNNFITVTYAFSVGSPGRKKVLYRPKLYATHNFL